MPDLICSRVVTVAMTRSHGTEDALTSSIAVRHWLSVARAPAWFGVSHEIAALRVIRCVPGRVCRPTVLRYRAAAVAALWRQVCGRGHSGWQGESAWRCGGWVADGVVFRHAVFVRADVGTCFRSHWPAADSALGPCGIGGLLFAVWLRVLVV